MRGQNALFKIAMKQYLGHLMLLEGGGAECFVATKDVLIVVRNLWSNYPSIYNPHEAATLVSVKLFK